MESFVTGTVEGSFEIRTDLAAVVESLCLTFILVITPFGIHASDNVAWIASTNVAAARCEIVTVMFAAAILWN
jgi:hypothetical protein